MEINELNKNRGLCLFSIALIMACYASERIIEVAFSITNTMAITMAIVYTIALAAVYFIVSKTSNAFYGLLAALVGYKMMPPSIPSLAQLSSDGTMLYYIVQKCGIVIFVLLIVKMFKAQKEKNKIALIPILAVLVVVPFFNEIGNVLGRYLMYTFGGSMLYAYFTSFALYALATLVIMMVIVRYDYNTVKFIVSYEFIALIINILRRIGIIAVNLINGQHVSGSHYSWIAIFAIAMIGFGIILKTEKKKQIKE